MAFRWELPAIAMLLAANLACGSGRHSAAAFRLPPDGDAERGKAAFVALGCHSCHEVSGVDLPRPTVQPPVPVVLGGVVDAKFSDAYLVTSIIYPSYELAPYPKDQITSHGQSRMPAYSDRMTLRQLTDIVTFLQSRYFVARREIVPPLTMLLPGD
jgi:mono/diheme cytochrome c family protein